MEGLVNVKKILISKNFYNCLILISLTCLLIEMTLIYLNIVNTTTTTSTNNDLKKCFLSIENFITVRQKYNNSQKFINEFEMKSYASSYTSPYLIELIQNSKRDCLCCP